MKNLNVKALGLMLQNDGCLNEIEIPLFLK